MAFFKDDTATRIEINTGVNFNAYEISGSFISYLKPSGITGSWDGTTVSGSESSGSIYIQFSDTVKFDESGVWEIYPVLYFTNGLHESGPNIIIPVE